MFAFVILLNYGYGAANSTPGFSFLGQGYDILKGNPLATTGFGDPGHRVDIFDFSHNEGRTTGDGRFDVADMTDVDILHTCRTQVDVDTFNSFFSYQRLIKNSFDVNGNFGPASFSLGVDSQHIRQMTETREEIYSHATAVCTAYQLTMHTGDSAPVNNNFQHFVNNLPLVYDQEAYMDMIREFGTHYINQMRVGGRWGHQLVMKTDNFVALEDDSINVRAGIKAAVENASKAGGGLNFNFTDQTTTNFKIVSSITQQSTYSVGGTYSQDSSQWIASVSAAPVPVHMTLTPLQELFTQDLLPLETVAAALEQKKANFERALEEYCSLEVGPAPTVEPAAPSCAVENNIDYPGHDIVHIDSVESAQECALRCGSHSECQSWTWAKNPTHPHFHRCWLKGAFKPNRQSNNCCLSGVSCISTAPTVEPAASACAMENNIDYPGHDILHIDSVESAQACALRCGSHSECQSWTWAKNPTHPHFHRCWLKGAFKPNRHSNDCCVSGVSCTNVCLAPAQPIPFPQPTPVAFNAVRRICVRNRGGYLMFWHLVNRGQKGSRTSTYPNPQTRCLDAGVDQPARGDRLSCEAKAIAGRTVGCEGADVSFDGRSRKQANYVCTGTTLSIKCRFDGISGLSGNNRRRLSGHTRRR